RPARACPVRGRPPQDDFPLHPLRYPVHGPDWHRARTLPAVRARKQPAEVLTALRMENSRRPSSAVIILLGLGAVLFALGGKLALIQRCGTDQPYADQWAAEGMWLL